MGGCQCSNANPENNLNVPNEEDNKEEKKEKEKNENDEKENTIKEGELLDIYEDDDDSD